MSEQRRQPGQRIVKWLKARVMEEGILTIIEEARAARLGHLAIVGADLPQWKVLKELEYNFALRSRHG